ncbi:MAG: 16S rRNA (guanine(966)-N(2))-methyltransferase RsmD [Terriglobales bacterium]
MIITGGEARGRRITIPEGLSVRPTASKIRQALFNILGARIKGAHFLDVFAGSGLMGIEALSRGAAALVAIEENRKMTRAIQDSLDRLEYRENARVMQGDFRSLFGHLPRRSFDIAFADPPYKSSFASSVVQSLAREELLKPDGILIVEHVKGYGFGELPGAMQLVDSRNYGQTGVSFFAPVSGDEAVKLDTDAG